MSRIKTVVVLLVLCAAGGLAQNSADAQSQVQTTRPKMIRVAGAVMVGLVEHRAVPEYPEQALTEGIEGDVIFKIVVDETGKITFSESVQGDPLLVATSMDALRDFRFRPYRLNGNPIRVESQLGFHFALHRKGETAKGHVEYMYTIPFRPEFRTEVLSDAGVSVLWPRKVSGAEPQLPPELAGKAGSVYLTITIGADGKVQDVKVLGGDEQFVSPVVAAVKQFVYEPQLVDGKPSVMTTPASYHFGRQH
jgi:TonB family protein